MRALAKVVAFDIAAGANGRVWVGGAGGADADPAAVIAAARAIAAGEHAGEEEAAALVAEVRRG